MQADNKKATAFTVTFEPNLKRFKRLQMLGGASATPNI